MPTAFSQTYRALAADRFGVRAAVLIVTAAILGGWAWWALRAEVPLWEITTDARVEQDAASYPVQSPFAGKLVRTELSLGKRVKKDDVLAEIDAQSDRLQIRQEQARMGALDSELGRLDAERAAEESARVAERQSARAAMEEAANRRREAETAAQFAEQEEQRLRKLREAKLLAEREHERAVAEARRLRQAVETTGATVARLEREQAARDRERDVRLERISSEAARIRGDRGTLIASVSRIGYEIERRKVRAPVDGRVAEAAVLHAGAVITEGEKLAAIVTEGEKLRIVAQYPAPAAFGRIRPGQHARVRLEGFPWAEFGTVQAAVSRVAEEVRAGKVRVELDILDSPGLRVPLQHGMPGAVEIEVERVTPAQLVLRTGGQWIAAPRERFEAK
ncbi:MAG: HlyD family efflux transporter periplasmic adaptor subunit [Bryobacteraceae bacterium]